MSSGPMPCRRSMARSLRGKGGSCSAGYSRASLSLPVKAPAPATQKPRPVPKAQRTGSQRVVHRPVPPVQPPAVLFVVSEPLGGAFWHLPRRALAAVWPACAESPRWTAHRGHPPVPTPSSAPHPAKPRPSAQLRAFMCLMYVRRDNLRPRDVALGPGPGMHGGACVQQWRDHMPNPRAVGARVAGRQFKSGPQRQCTARPAPPQLCQTHTVP